MINGGGLSWRGVPLIGLEDVVGGTLAVVAPPLRPLGRVIGPFAHAGCVGGIILRARPHLPAGEPHVAQQ